ncbi:DNA-binding response regulator [Candidatus Micrarchaeota archaeon]|nr:MAG: DNA-binding response regulator [Candidatus Micrarchaeota archaeon]
MAKPHVLVIDDEEDILELLRYHLSREGYTVECVSDGEKALESVRRKVPDIILLDLMLPGIGGLELCKLLRRDDRTAQIPIVMLTARSEEADVVAGLEIGADDYITKPFSPRVLVARVKAVLRRRKLESSQAGTLIRGDLAIYPHRYEVQVKGEPVALTVGEFKILHFLARRPGWVFTREQILSAVHGEDYPVAGRSVDVLIASLRRKLGEAGSMIETVRGVGYRFREEGIYS